MALQKPLVSIIITTKNEEKNIGNCLKSIINSNIALEQYRHIDKKKKEPIRLKSYKAKSLSKPLSYEIIVVDNNSTDRTKEIAKKYTNKVYNFPNPDKIKDVKNFRGAQLNFGVKKSKGEIIFFPDADMTFDKELLQELIKKLKKHYALYIPEIVMGRGLLGKIRNFERSFYNATCIDAIRVIKKDLFLRVGGFDEKNIAFGPDDWDFTKTVKKNTDKIGITKSRIYHHEEEMTVKKYLSKKSKYSQTFDDYIKKWGKNDPDIKKQFGLWYRYFGVFIEDGKWKRLLRHPLLAGGMYFLRGAVGVVFICKKIFPARHGNI